MKQSRINNSCCSRLLAAIVGRLTVPEAVIQQGQSVLFMLMTAITAVVLLSDFIILSLLCCTIMFC